MICTALSYGDDIPSPSAWIKKFDLSKQVEFFGGEGEIWTLAPVNPTYTLSRGASSTT